MKKTQLKHYTPLRSKKGLNKMSARAKAELKVWSKVVADRKEALIEIYEYLPCELCYEAIRDGDQFYCAEGHHNNHNRRDNTLDNCRITHRVCNQIIEDRNIKDVPSML